MFSSYVWGTCPVPGPDLKAEDSAGNHKDQIPDFIVYVPVEDTNDKQISLYKIVITINVNKNK